MGDDLGIMSRRFEIRNVGEAREKGKHSHQNVSCGTSLNLRGEKLDYHD